ncbi:MAG: hypothetical protein AWU57_880 [Marinobacter sp. T13-3]|jgi:hypothetical protein|nr:MAG: hypothetical protein AWU57_880 [Marinobacter sp. T13-3]
MVTGFPARSNSIAVDTFHIPGKPFEVGFDHLTQ